MSTVPMESSFEPSIPRLEFRDYCLVKVTFHQSNNNILKSLLFKSPTGDEIQTDLVTTALK